jgi:hypothetical protein
LAVLVARVVLELAITYYASDSQATGESHIPAQGPVGKRIGAHHIVQKFFEIYAEWQWERECVSVWDVVSAPPPSNSSPAVGAGTQVRPAQIAGPKPNYTYKRQPNKEPFVILSLTPPLANLSFHASKGSLETLRRVLREGLEALRSEQSWEEVCSASSSVSPSSLSSFAATMTTTAMKMRGYEKFLREYKGYIKVEVNFWGGEVRKGRDLVGWIESRFVSVSLSLWVHFLFILEIFSIILFIRLVLTLLPFCM